MKANQTKTVEQLLEANRALNFASHLRLSSESDLEVPKPVYPSTLHYLRDRKVPNTFHKASNAKGIASTTATSNATGDQDEPMTDIGSDFISPDIADPLFDSVLDENREMVINQLVYRAGNDYCFFYPIGQEALVEDFYSKIDTGEINLTDADLHSFGDLVVQRTSLVTNDTGSSASFSVPFFGNRSVEGNANWDSSHRIECQIWQGNWLVYSSSGIKTHATQYARKWVFFHGWVDFKTDRVAASATVSYNLPNPYGTSTTQTSTALSVAETNAAVAVKRFDWSTAQIGYSNNPQGSVGAQIQAIILSNMTITVSNPYYIPNQPPPCPSCPYPHPTFSSSSLTLTITGLTSNHSGQWGSRGVQKTLTW